MTRTSLGFVIEKFDGRHTWDVLNSDNTFDQWTFDNDAKSTFKRPKFFKTEQLANNHVSKHFKNDKALFRVREYFSVKY